MRRDSFIGVKGTLEVFRKYRTPACDTERPARASSTSLALLRMAEVTASSSHSLSYSFSSGEWAISVLHVTIL